MCNGVCKDGSLCKYKSKITDTNGKHFCCVHVGQGALEEKDCSICMDALCKQPLTLTKCKHVFHTKCLKNWTTNFNTNCPLCRAQIFPCKLVGTSSTQLRLDFQREIELRMTEISAIRRTLFTEFQYFTVSQVNY
jgi:hypothetical protein